jgi:hypothetical protein
MKNTNGKTQLYQQSPAGSFASASRRLALTALLLCGLAISTSAQEAGSYKIAAEKGFTVVPNVQTPIVLKTMPDAACDLHAKGASESSHKLRFYANGDGYVKIHASAKRESEDGIHVQLDCQANGKATRYPLHLRASSSATVDMPAPQTVMAAPKGSQVMPALSAQEAQQLSDDELIGRGFPPRPDPSTSPDAYAKWVDLVSQPITVVPPHLVSRTDIVHSSAQGISQQQGVQNGFGTSANWSGYVVQGAYRGYTAAYGQWNIPTVVACESNTTTYSSFWVGLDGYGSQDLVQDGTEHDCTDYWGIFNFTSYSAWEELLPNQPYSQNVSLSPNPGDSFWALAWVGDANRQYDPNGAYGWFNMWDLTQRQGVLVGVALGSTRFYGSTAEWIMERPYLSSGQYAQLSDYSAALMSNPEVLTSSFNWTYFSSLSNTEIWMYNDYLGGNDNNLLSAAAAYGQASIYYYWFNYH